MALQKRDTLAIATLAYAAAAIAIVGVDAWIVRAWLLSAGVLLVLGLLGRLLQREFRVRPPGPGGQKLVWAAAGVGAFVSCTLAAGLVGRHGSGSLVPLFLMLGGLMLLSVILVRLAYHQPSGGQGADRNA